MLFRLFSFLLLLVCFVLTMVMSATCVRCSSVYVLRRIVCGFVLSAGLEKGVANEKSFQMRFAGDRLRSFWDDPVWLTLCG